MMLRRRGSRGSFVVGWLTLAVLYASVDRLPAQDTASAAAPRRPNVLLIMTDDQGYGDLSCHGNPKLKTPAIDWLHDQSLRLTNFHVDSTCAPTRSSIMTGKYSTRVGVWHTIAGRSLLRTGETTLAEAFGAAGYKTGIFGKWHLGDNAPLRPQDRGFQESLVHRGGGVGQTPDWGNDYFDDVYLRNGRPEPQQGYCTDVFFSAATKFVEEQKEQPFFCYLVTNAPHDPYRVAPKYSKPYVEAGVPQPMANFYGMIANIDENVGRLMARLEELKLAENTLVVFMTDNGTAAGWAPNAKSDYRGFNAGMREKKVSQFDGGHRVPCFLRWPERIVPRDVNGLTAHIDLFPTFAEICGLKTDGIEFDGRSFAGLFSGQGEPADRTLFVHTQRIEIPQKWRLSAVMTQRWRLIDGAQLYDMAADPGQTQDVAAKFPEEVRRLRDEYEAWWKSLEPRFSEVVSIAIGDEREPVTQLCCHDWHAPAAPSSSERLAEDPAVNGWWAIDVTKPGKYEFVLRRRPANDPAPLFAGEGAEEVTAAIDVGGRAAEAKVKSTELGAPLTLELPVGPTKLTTRLTDAKGNSRGAYFVEVRLVK